MRSRNERSIKICNKFFGSFYSIFNCDRASKITTNTKRMKDFKTIYAQNQQSEFNTIHFFVGFLPAILSYRNHKPPQSASRP